MFFINKYHLWALSFAIVALVFLFGFNLSHVFAAELADQTIGYYKLTTVISGPPYWYSDWSNGAYDITAYNNITEVSGKFDNAVELNGSNSYFNIPAAATFDDNSSSSLSFWTKPLGSAASQMMFDIEGSYSYIFFSYDASGSGQLYIDGRGISPLAPQTQISSVMSKNVWHNLIINTNHGPDFNMIHVKFYLDGTQIGSTWDFSENELFGAGGTTWRVGRHSSGIYYNGDFDDVGIWQDALTDDQITALQTHPISEVGSGGGGVTYSDSLSLVFPEASGQINADAFDHYSFEVSRSTSTGSFIVGLAVATDTSNFSNCPNQVDSGESPPNHSCWWSPLAIPAAGTSTSFYEATWSYFLASSTYYGQLQLWDFSGNNFVFTTSSPPQAFNILAEGSSYFPPPDFSSISTTTPDFGLVGNVFVSILRWAFVPPQVAFEIWGQLSSVLVLKPPIGYFTLIKETFLSINQNASSTYAFPALAQLSFFQQVRAMLVLMIWFAFGFYVFNRLRHLQL